MSSWIESRLILTPDGEARAGSGAARHDASIVIWIFKDIGEEHRNAIDTQTIVYFPLARAKKSIRVNEENP